MSFHERPNGYREWFDIARTTLWHRQGQGEVYYDGVERAAALAALAEQARGKEAQIDAMIDVFARYHDRSPRWDGSIA